MIALMRRPIMRAVATVALLTASLCDSRAVDSDDFLRHFATIADARLGVIWRHFASTEHILQTASPVLSSRSSTREAGASHFPRPKAALDGRPVQTE